MARACGVRCRRALTAAVLSAALASGCAPRLVPKQTAQEREAPQAFEFRALRGRPIAVEVIDARGGSTGSGDMVVQHTRELVTEQLRHSGLVVVDDADTALRVRLIEYGTRRDSAEYTACVGFVGAIVHRERAFLPSLEVRSERCLTESRPTNVYGAAAVAVGEVLSPQPHSRLADAHDAALRALLVELDARLR